MNDLVNLGFLKNTIVEVIVSTFDAEEQPNAAPMGVMTEDTEHIIIRPYTSTLTYMNLKLKRCAVVNVTGDPDLFYRTAFKEANPHEQVPQEWFEQAEVVDAPRLRMADAFVEVSVIETKSLEIERAEFLCAVKQIRASRLPPKAYCRATFATIEAVIHATRVKLFLNSKDKERREQANKLMELIKHYNAVVSRVAPQSRCSEIMAELISKINLWKRES